MVKSDWRFGVKLIAPVISILLVIGLLSGPIAKKIIFTWSINDMDLRAKLITHSLSDDIFTQLSSDKSQKVQRQFDNLVKDERLYAVGFCSTTRKISNSSKSFPTDINCESYLSDTYTDTLVMPSGVNLYVSSIPITQDDSTSNTPAPPPERIGNLIILHNLSYVGIRVEQTQNLIQIGVFISGILLISLMFLLGELTRRIWVKNIREGIVNWHSGGKAGKFDPILDDVKKLIEQMESERKLWDAEAIRQIIHTHLNESEIFVLSNREPYSHHLAENGNIEIETPAGGVVTALEPIVSACNGTWIAYGSGSGDKAVVDQNDCVMLPPDAPKFKLKRIWLSEEEKNRYYNGFSNEALYPLCLLTHTRPTFRTLDWEAYVAVNQKFADAVIKESKSDNPLILVQDYHLALAPRMIKDRLPNANIITFWHITWPNPEIFNICPWKEEILDGLLASQMIGFHTSQHVQNFLYTVQQTLQSKVDLVKSQIHYNSSICKIGAYPMSIEWPKGSIISHEEAKKCICKENNLSTDIKIGVGIDRLDYTKGILERFHAVERMLDLNPGLQGKFSFIQIAAPSRLEVTAYKEYIIEAGNEVARINRKFSQFDIPPITLRDFHHNREEVYTYCKAADLCFISSLHDGMNLVAKEFISTRDDEQGVLVLSEFTGAATTLTDALLVNPYHIDECASALAHALFMHPAEQRTRMRAMRRQVRENNIFRWAGHLLIDSSEINRQNKMLYASNLKRIDSSNMKK